MIRLSLIKDFAFVDGDLLRTIPASHFLLFSVPVACSACH